MVDRADKEIGVGMPEAGEQDFVPKGFLPKRERPFTEFSNNIKGSRLDKLL